MNWLPVIALTAGFLGGALGYLLTRGVVKSVGIPLDERGNEIAKLAAARTLEAVLLMIVVFLYYSLTVVGNELCSEILSALLALIILGNLTLKFYYGRKM